MPVAARDAAFQAFVRAACGNHGALATQLYQRLTESFNLTISYDDKFYVFEDVSKGHSAMFNIPDKEDFILRMDVRAGTAAADSAPSVRIPLVHCADYMQLVDEMPEHIKRCFRISDCKSCTCSCPYCMAYRFEGTAYKQCHFITISLDSVENMEHILVLVSAEHEKWTAGKTGSKQAYAAT